MSIKIYFREAVRSAVGINGKFGMKKNYSSLEGIAVGNAIIVSFRRYDDAE